MPKQLTATRALTYASRRLRAGDPFTASKQDAVVLVALGRARYQAAVAVPEVVKHVPPEEQSVADPVTASEAVHETAHEEAPEVPAVETGKKAKRGKRE